MVLTETSDTWIDLNDELSFLRKTKQFVWASARDGFTHLYLYDYDGHLLRRLTAGPWCVDDFRARAIKAHRREAAPDLLHGHRKSARWSASCTAPRSTAAIPSGPNASPKRMGCMT